MHLRDQNWAKSYAKQALSDLRAREALVSAGAEKCHRLHFLQMAAEKTCKAHLTLAQRHDNVKKTHACIKDNLPVIARKTYPATGQNSKIAQWELTAIKHLAGEIELLAPACDHGGARKDNTEYPWEADTGEVHTPCQYTFPNIDDGPENRTINRLVRLIRTAAEAFSQ